MGALTSHYSNERTEGGRWVITRWSAMRGSRRSLAACARGLRGPGLPEAAMSHPAGHGRVWGLHVRSLSFPLLLCLFFSLQVPCYSGRRLGLDVQGKHKVKLTGLTKKGIYAKKSETKSESRLLGWFSSLLVVCLLHW